MLLLLWSCCRYIWYMVYIYMGYPYRAVSTRHTSGQQKNMKNFFLALFSNVCTYTVYDVIWYTYQYIYGVEFRENQKVELFN